MWYGRWKRVGKALLLHQHRLLLEELHLRLLEALLLHLHAQLLQALLLAQM